MSQENNFIPNQENYKPLTPFQLFVKSNFPFIENTFEALDNYGLYCKIVEYLNNVIENENTVESNVQALYNAFISLNTYVSDYFDNLDVQEEINNKLDEMATNGELGNIINGLFGELENQINSVASGSPAGVYATTDALSSADPDHSRIYLVTANGHWYYYSTSLSSWADGGTYQSSGISAGSIGSLQTSTDISYNIQFNKTPFAQNYNRFVTTEYEIGYITPSNGNNNDHSTATVRNSLFHTLENKEIIFKTNNSNLRFRYYAYNADNSYDIDNSAANWLNNNGTFTPLLNKKYRFAIGTVDNSDFTMNYLTQCGVFYSDEVVENNLEKLKELSIQNNNNYNINYKYMPFSSNANTFVSEIKNINNFEIGSITHTNGNNMSGSYPAYARHKKAIQVKNCIVVNLKPAQYEYRMIYYSALNGYNSSTFVGSTSFSSLFRSFLDNEHGQNKSIYLRMIIHDKVNVNIDMNDALNNVFIIEQTEKVNMKKPFIDVMLHQGGIGLGIDTPSNTLVAFSNSAKYDVTGFETDVRKTLDGTYIISHDVERTSVDNVTINVNETSYSTIDSMQFYADETIKIPTLEEAVKNAKINGMKIDIELKDTFSQEDINNICDIVKQNSMEEHCVFSSFIISNLTYVRNVFGKIPVIIGLSNIIDPEDIETDAQYSNIRALRTQGKTLFSLENTVISANISTIENYIKNGFYIRMCYYGTDCSAITSLVQYADTILFNTQDYYSLLNYLAR